jgi:hypothetical protein
VVWDPESKGAQAYMALAQELLERERVAEPAEVEAANKGEHEQQT